MRPQNTQGYSSTPPKCLRTLRAARLHLPSVLLRAALGKWLWRESQLGRNFRKPTARQVRRGFPRHLGPGSRSRYPEKGAEVSHHNPKLRKPQAPPGFQVHLSPKPEPRCFLAEWASSGTRVSVPVRLAPGAWCRGGGGTPLLTQATGPGGPSQQQGLSTHSFCFPHPPRKIKPRAREQGQESVSSQQWKTDSPINRDSFLLYRPLGSAQAYRSSEGWSTVTHPGQELPGREGLRTGLPTRQETTSLGRCPKNSHNGKKVR